MAEETSPEKTTAEESFLSQPNSDAQGQLTVAIDELLDQLQGKFDHVSKEVFGKLDDMTRRLDELEASMAGSANQSAPSASAK